MYISVLDCMKKFRLNPRIVYKVAYANHMDDVIETAFLSMIFEGRFYVFPPKTYMEDSDLTIIRPLIYVSEAEVKGFRNKYQLPVVKNPCPMDGYTKREYVKKLIQQLNIVRLRRSLIQTSKLKELSLHLILQRKQIY